MILEISHCADSKEAMSENYITSKGSDAATSMAYCTLVAVHACVLAVREQLVTSTGGCLRPCTEVAKMGCEIGSQPQCVGPVVDA